MNNIFNEAIESHAQWKTVLLKNLDAGVSQDVNTIGDFRVCNLGRWINGDGAKYHQITSFGSMCDAHERFHRAAAEVVARINANDKAEAESLLAVDGEFTLSSAKLIKALMDCYKDVADAVVGGLRNRRKVKDILKAKENNAVFTVQGDVSSMEAIKMMVDHNIGSLAVDKDGRFHGLFTERGYLQRLLSRGSDALNAPISEMIDTNTVYVDPEDSVELCMVLMTAMHTRHLPVMETDKLVGMISIGDVIKHVVSESNEKISQLDAYVHGSYGAQ
ncbi:MAG: CBS domain-containing protein [Gammaproteobacteria bacterium]